MISGDALIVAGATVGVLGLQQWLMHNDNRKRFTRWIDRLSIHLVEFPLHKHNKDGSIEYPKSKLDQRSINGSGAHENL